MCGFHVAGKADAAGFEGVDDAVHREDELHREDALHRDDAAPKSEGGAPADPDLLDSLGDEIATLAAHIHAATHRLLALIARFDRLKGWEVGGYRSCAHWLSLRTGIDLGAAREKVRAARALEALPETAASMARGELSFSQVRALTRVATKETEGDLLELARNASTASLERIVRSWKRRSRLDEAEWERELHRSRGLSVFPDGEGMYVVKGRLTPEVAAVLMRAVEAASDALYRKAEKKLPRTETETERVAEAKRRRADAIGLVCERALELGFGGKDEEGSGTDSEAPISGTRAARTQVMLHVDAATLSAEGEPGRSELEDGTRVSAETSRRLACDAGLVRVDHAKDGSVLDVGRRTRTISPALRRALETRDRGCRFPGCGLRFTDAHHVRHWADGGPTSLANCLLLCRFHHRLVHEAGWRVTVDARGRARFVDPRGFVHHDGRRPRVVIGEDPVGALMAANRKAMEAARQESTGEAADEAADEASPGPTTASARWEREQDIPDTVLLRSIEALLEGDRGRDRSGDAPD